MENDFEKKTSIEVHLSGLPLIRTVVADRLQKEMKIFLLLYKLNQAKKGLNLQLFTLFFCLKAKFFNLKRK